MIGILGGTFDPPHWGHLKLAQNFIETLNLDQLIFIPAGEPWQKSPDITPSEIRFQLTQAAALDLQSLIGSNSKVNIEVSRLELDRHGPSYAIDSAKALRQIYGANEPIVWLMGSDSFNHLPSWKDWEQLPNYLHIAVANRTGNSSEYLDEIELSSFKDRISNDPKDLIDLPFGKIFFDHNFQVDLSSTHIRQGLRANSTELELSKAIPPKTLELIKSLGIYQ